MAGQPATASSTKASSDVIRFPVERRQEAAHAAMMQAEDGTGGVPRLALRMQEAAEALGMSVDSFERYVEHQIGLLRVGRLKLVPVTELKRFIDENAYRVGGDW